MVFNGTSQTLAFTGTVPSFAFGTEEFTVEFDFYFTASGGCGFINVSGTNTFLSPLVDTIGVSGRVILNNVNTITGLVFPSSTWGHFSLCRAVNTLTARIGGVTKGTADVTGVSIGASTFNGLGIASNYYVKGEIANLFVTREALRLIDFTPPNRAR